MRPGKFYRSTREAFAVERFPAVFGPYRRPLLERWSVALGWICLVGLLIGIGVLLAWRG